MPKQFKIRCLNNQIPIVIQVVNISVVHNRWDSNHKDSVEELMALLLSLKQLEEDRLRLLGRFKTVVVHMKEKALEIANHMLDLLMPQVLELDRQEEVHCMEELSNPPIDLKLSKIQISIANLKVCCQIT